MDTAKNQNQWVGRGILQLEYKLVEKRTNQKGIAGENKE